MLLCNEEVGIVYICLSIAFVGYSQVNWVNILK